MRGSGKLFELRLATGTHKIFKTTKISHLDPNMVERKIQEMVFVFFEDVFAKGFFRAEHKEKVEKYFQHVLSELKELSWQLNIAYKTSKMLKDKRGEGNKKIEGLVSNPTATMVISKF